MGAKNHAIVLPDASIDATLNALVVAAGFGAAGQKMHGLEYRSFRWEDNRVELAKSLRVNSGMEPEADLGPVISKQAKEQIYKLIQSGVDDEQIIKSRLRH